MSTTWFKVCDGCGTRRELVQHPTERPFAYLTLSQELEKDPPVVRTHPTRERKVSADLCSGCCLRLAGVFPELFQKARWEERAEEFDRAEKDRERWQKEAREAVENSTYGADEHG